jgi:putative chitinase
MIITPEKLKQVCPKLTDKDAAEIASLFTELCPKYGINTYDIFHEFIARLAHECAEFTKYSESLNYSVEGLQKFVKWKRITASQADQYGRKPGQKANRQMIANIIYGGAWGKKNLGNTLPNDGWNLRGSGAIQTTGRANTQRYCNYVNKRDNTNYTVEQMAELMRTSHRWAIDSACWIFAISFKLIDEAIDDELKAICDRINGGALGFTDTVKYYEKAKVAFQ